MLFSVLMSIIYLYCYLTGALFYTVIASNAVFYSCLLFSLLVDFVGAYFYWDMIRRF